MKLDDSKFLRKIPAAVYAGMTEGALVERLKPVTVDGGDKAWRVVDLDRVAEKFKPAETVEDRKERLRAWREKHARAAAEKYRSEEREANRALRIEAKKAAEDAARTRLGASMRAPRVAEDERLARKPAAAYLGIAPQTLMKISETAPELASSNGAQWLVADLERYAQRTRPDETKAAREERLFIMREIANRNARRVAREGYAKPRTKAVAPVARPVAAPKPASSLKPVARKDASPVDFVGRPQIVPLHPEREALIVEGRERAAARAREEAVAAFAELARLREEAEQLREEIARLRGERDALAREAPTTAITRGWETKGARSASDQVSRNIEDCA